MLSYRRFANHENLPIPLTPTVHNQVWNVTGTERAEYIEALSVQKVNTTLHSLIDYFMKVSANMSQ